MRTAVALVAAVLAGLFGPAVAPAQTTFGADLNRPANATFGCEALPITDPFGGRTFLPSRQTTCTYLATGVLGATAETTTPIVAGLVTAVRVKVGAVTGPMQITVLRSFRTLPTPECCFHAGATATFTPAPNAVTTIPVRIFLRNDIDANARETVDRLAITVLAPGVPIPAHDTGNPGAVTNPAALAFFPAVGPGDAVTGRVDGAGIGGIQPLINADITPICPSAGARIAQAGGRCLALLAPASSSVRLRAGRVPLRLVCNGPDTCAGRVLVQTRRAGATRNLTLASAAVRVAAGQTAAVAPRLTRAGRSALRGRRVMAAWVNGSIRSGATSVGTTARITLRR